MTDVQDEIIFFPGSRNKFSFPYTGLFWKPSCDSWFGLANKTIKGNLYRHTGPYVPFSLDIAEKSTPERDYNLRKIDGVWLAKADVRVGVSTIGEATRTRLDAKLIGCLFSLYDGHNPRTEDPDQRICYVRDMAEIILRKDLTDYHGLQPSSN